MTERSLPSLYGGNKAKLGEILMQSSLPNGQNEPAVIGLRVPSGVFLIQDERRGTFYKSECTSHVPMFRNSDQSVEW